MTPLYDDGQAVIHLGDVRDVLRELPEQSAHTCVTSPPYWGLRDYGTATWDGGDAECDHKGGPLRTMAQVNEHTNGANSINVPNEFYRETCGKCGAKRIDRQLGLEPTPEEYVANMVDVFREVRRVLRDDGTLWLNIGDSYATGAGKVGDHPGGGEQGERWKGNRGIRPGSEKHANGAMGPMNQPNRMPLPGLKPKDLVGIPWMLAFALRADGWYLRSDIIWAKPNPMPESVTDRPTKAHEYLFLLSKRERYYYDQAAIAEPYKDASLERMASGWNGNNFRDWPGGNHNNMDRYMGRTPEEIAKYEADGRNKRTVWTIATQPYPEAHFATFPEALVEPCILAGSPSGGTVLEPFAGSGTTLAVAKRLGRRAVGIELNEAYIDLARKRCAQMGMVLP